LASFRFLHAADIHLDSPLRGLHGQEGSAAQRIRGATREAFGRLIDAALEHRVDFLIIAGDLYDGDWRDYRTGLFFAAQMGRLQAAGIAVFLVRGNHDAQSQITRSLALPENVRVFDARAAESLRLDALDVVLHGQSFKQREVRDNLVPGYPPAEAARFNIGVLHTGLGGLGGHENYAPCSLQDLKAKGYDYWALGHVHQYQILSRHPHVVFPGNLQGRHIRETGAKGAVLVSVADGAVTDVTLQPCDVVRWNRVSVSVEGAAGRAEVVERIRVGLERVSRTEADGRLLACRVELRGRTPWHDPLVADADGLLAEARAAALGLGVDAAWIERVVVATQAERGADTLAARDDALGALQQMLDQAAADPELLAQLAEDPGQMLRHLPHPVRVDVDPDSLLQAALDEDPAALIAGVRPFLASRLRAEDD